MRLTNWMASQSEPVTRQKGRGKPQLLSELFDGGFFAYWLSVWSHCAGTKITEVPSPGHIREEEGGFTVVLQSINSPRRPYWAC